MSNFVVAKNMQAHQEPCQLVEMKGVVAGEPPIDSSTDIDAVDIRHDSVIRVTDWQSACSGLVL